MFKHISIYLLIVCLFKEEAVLKEAGEESNGSCGTENSPLIFIPDQFSLII